jgi:hypothetical protein
MLEKKRARSLKDLALVPACVRWRLLEKIKKEKVSASLVPYFCIAIARRKTCITKYQYQNNLVTLSAGRSQFYQPGSAVSL